MKFKYTILYLSLLLFSFTLLATEERTIRSSRKLSSPVRQVHSTIEKGKDINKNITQQKGILSSGIITSSSGVIEKTLYFEESMLSFSTERDYDLVDIPNATHMTDIGYPSLPEMSIKMLIPPGATATRIEVISCEKKTIPGEFNIFPAQPPVKISSNKEIPSFVEPNPSVYNSEKPYPSNLLSDRIHNGTKCGYRIADFFVYPLQYIPLEKKLILYTTITIRIYYEGGESSVKSITQHQKEIFGSSVKGMVTNPENIEIWAPPVVRNKGPYGDWEMVIIAPNNSTWIDSLQVLADWKTKKGVPCMVKNLQDIYNAYSGSTDQWKIKQYINDMKTDSGTIWVLFGADHGTNATNSIPCRGVYAYYGCLSVPITCHDMPSERYYEDLNNDWNHNNNSDYGENTDGLGGGQLDWYADVYVGRMFADNVADAGKYMRRILWYEKNPDQDFCKRALFSSTYLFDRPPNHGHGYTRTDDWASHIPSGWDMWGQATRPGFHFGQTDAIPDNYPGDQVFLQDTLSAGHGFYGTAGHGHYNLFMGDDNVATQYITNNEVDNWLDPGMKCGIFTANACLSGGFDQASDCVAEHLYDKGMIGGAWNSRDGIGQASDNISALHNYSDGIIWQFFVQTFDSNKYHLGQAIAEAKDHFAGSLNNSCFNACLKEYNTFGDPELPMWTAANGPDMLSVTHDPTVPTGASNFTVNVKDNDNVTNIQGARICCWCKSETSMYKKDTTNSSGNVTLSINPTIVGDTMWVTVTKQNYKPYEGYAAVTGNAKPTIPTIIRIFDNAIFDASPTYECTLSFVSTDPDNDDIQYQIQWDPAPNFSSPSSKNTGNFSSGTTVTTTILLGSTPAEVETLFYWKVRATDPDGSGNWSNWSDTRSFTMDMEVEDVYWYQVGGNQFSQCTMNNVTVQGDSVILTQGISGVDTLTYWNPNAADSFYHRQPDNYNDVNYSVRFTPLHPGTLTTAFFWLYHLVGSGNIRIHVWDDASGWPGSELGYVDYHTDSVNIDGSATVVDLSSLSINVNTSSDFYVGYSLLSGVDTLGLMLDTVGYHPERCYDYWTGHGWEKSGWIHSNMTWLIEAAVEYGSEIPEGSLISPAVVYSDLTTENPDRNDWDGVKWTKSSADDSIGIQIEYKHNGPWTLVPDNAIGAQGGDSNSTGFFDLDTNFCTVDLSNLTPNTYDTLRIKALFGKGTTKASSNPALYMWAMGNTKSNVTFVSPTDRPLVFALNRNQPNPFATSTEISYQLARKANVELKVFDIMGRSVITLVKGVQKAGFYSIPWRGSDKNGKSLPSGVYFLRMKASEFKATQKIVLIR